MSTRFDPDLNAHTSSVLDQALDAARTALPHAREVAALRARLEPLPPVASALAPAASVASGAWLVWSGLGTLLIGGAVAWVALPTLSTAPLSHADRAAAPERAAQAVEASTTTIAAAHPTRAPAQVPPVPSAEAAPSAVAPAHAAPARKSLRREPSAARAAPTAEVTTDDPLAELALVQRAERSLALSPRRSLALLDQHRQQHPTGTFAQEAESLRVDALVAMGRDDEARTHAEAFLLRFANSPQRLRLERLLQRSPQAADKIPDSAPPTLRNQEVWP